MEKTADAYRTISEVASDLDLPQHVLRFWETRFPQVRPLKRAGGRRYYRPSDVVALRKIRRLLYDDGYTIKGVQRLLKERGIRELRETPPDEVAAAEEPLSTGGITDDHERSEGKQGGTEERSEGAFSEIGRGTQAGGSVVDPSVLRDCLAIIEECERILRQARPA